MIVSLGRLPLHELYLRGQKRQRETAGDDTQEQAPGSSTVHPAAAWAAELAGSYPNNGAQTAYNDDSAEAGPSRMGDASAAGAAFAQNADMSWLTQLDQSSYSGALDLSELLGLGSVPQDGPPGDNAHSEWPFGLESDILHGGVNPSQTLSADMFFGPGGYENDVFAPPTAERTQHFQ